MACQRTRRYPKIQSSSLNKRYKSAANWHNKRRTSWRSYAKIRKKPKTRENKNLEEKCLPTATFPDGATLCLTLKKHLKRPSSARISACPAKSSLICQQINHKIRYQVERTQETVYMRIFRSWMTAWRDFRTSASPSSLVNSHPRISRKRLCVRNRAVVQNWAQSFRVTKTVFRRVATRINRNKKINHYAMMVKQTLAANKTTARNLIKNKRVGNVSQANTVEEVLIRRSRNPSYHYPHSHTLNSKVT